MLSSDQIAELAIALCATAETIGQTLSANAAQLIAEDLAEYKQEHIVCALRACRRELTGKLTLSSIVQRINAEDGRPGRDEAWSIALASTDEFDTVVMTDEIITALQSARPLLELRDHVGARMAFLSTYDRLLADSRKRNVPVNWAVSIGFDAQRRVTAVKQAVQLGRISGDAGQRHIAALTVEPLTADGAAIAGLLTGTTGNPSPDVREKLDAIRTDLKRARDQREAETNAAREQRRRSHAEKVRKHLDSVAMMMKKEARA